jgi:hypothetical protein
MGGWCLQAAQEIAYLIITAVHSVIVERIQWVVTQEDAPHVKWGNIQGPKELQSAVHVSQVFMALLHSSVCVQPVLLGSIVNQTDSLCAPCVLLVHTGQGLEGVQLQCVSLVELVSSPLLWVQCPVQHARIAL